MGGSLANRPFEPQPIHRFLVAELDHFQSSTCSEPRAYPQAWEQGVIIVFERKTCHQSSRPSFVDVCAGGMPDTCCCSPVPTIPKESGSRSGPDLIDRGNACIVVLPRVCHFAPFHMQCMGRGPTSTTPPSQRLRKHVSDCGLLGRLRSSTLAAIRTKPVALWSRLFLVLRNAGDFASVSRNHLDQSS